MQKMCKFIVFLIHKKTLPCTASAMRERVLSFSFYSSILPKLR